MSRFVSKFEVVNVWNEVHPPGSGCTAGLDTERCAAKRGWEVNCSCGRMGFVWESEEGLTVQKHLPNGQVCDVYVLREQRGVRYGSWTSQRIAIGKGNETTTTTLDDMAYATISALGIQACRDAHENAKKRRGAMAAMATSCAARTRR